MSIVTEPLLECRAVARHFGALKAVKDVSFVLQPGEILGIGGPNGAGKTTLFEVISCFQPPSSGTIRFLGADVTGSPARTALKRGMARVFQANTAFDTLTARENVLVGTLFGTGKMPLRMTAAANREADAALDRVGLGARGDAVAGEMSVLDRKLLMFATAIACRPRLLLLDEPVGGLTLAEMKPIADLVRSFAAEGLGVLLIEHVMRFMTELAGRILILHHGELIFQGMPADMARDPTVREVYLGEAAGKKLSDDLDTSTVTRRVAT